MTTNLERLLAPFHPASVSWRVGSVNGDKTRGMALAYIDARDVMRRLDEAVGPANWRNEYHMVGNRLVCTISIRCGDEWVGKTDGAGDTDVEPEKGGLSDAFKRAAVHWGIGRYLYDLDSPWVELKNGKYIVDSEYAKLRKVLENAAGRTTTPTPAPAPAPAMPQPATGRQVDEVIALLTSHGKDEEKAAAWASDNRVRRAADLTSTEAAKLIAKLSAAQTSHA